MVKWHPGEPVPNQLGDAFASLYDWFEPRHAVDADDNVWLDRLPDTLHYRWIRMSVEQAGDETPKSIEKYIDTTLSAGGESDIAYTVFVCLCAIDRGVRHQIPSKSDISYRGAGSGLLSQYRRHYRFNSDATDGYVLPKWTGERFRGSSSSFQDYFVNLVRANVSRDYIRLLGPSARSRPPAKPSIVVVPTLYEFTGHGSGLGEAHFTGLELRGTPYFKVEHDPKAMDHLRTRVKESVRAIHQSGASIAVYPELVLNQELLETLRESLLLESRQEDNRRSGLHWVMAGAGVPSGDNNKWPFKNTCYVFDRRGHLVSSSVGSGEKISWIQEKRYRYKLSREEQTDYYGIADCFPNCVDREEAISRGRHLYVFEDDGNRFAVLMCDDLAEERDTVQLARDMLCSVIITIVMDGPVSKNRWHGSRSKEFATRTGALTVVANSLLLPNLTTIRQYAVDKGHVERDPYPDENLPVGLMCIPTPGGPPVIEEITARATPVSGEPETLVSERQLIPLFRS